MKLGDETMNRRIILIREVKRDAQTEPVAGFCEHGEEYSLSIKGVHFLTSRLTVNS
jgi:hypothetical protein